MSGKNSTHYVYIHKTLTDGRIFYIGKGCGRRGFYSSGRNQDWHDVADSEGFEAFIIYRCHSHKEALELEALCIDQAMDSGVPLTNLCRGGQGCYGYKHSQAKISGMSGDKNPMKSPEVREKISGDNHWRKRRPWFDNTGWKQTDDAKQKISRANKGLKRNQATKDFLRDRQLNMSEETRAKISQSVKLIPKIKCPHCDREGSPSNMKRWHFDSCKHLTA